jgi:hypothetical protein
VAVVQRMAVVQSLVKNTRLSHTRISRAGDSGPPLLTGGRCSEVAVSTGLTVVIQIVVQISFRMVVKIAIVQHVIQIVVYSGCSSFGHSNSSGTCH